MSLTATRLATLILLQRMVLLVVLLPLLSRVMEFFNIDKVVEVRRTIIIHLRLLFVTTLLPRVGVGSLNSHLLLQLFAKFFHLNFDLIEVLVLFLVEFLQFF